MARDVLVMSMEDIDRSSLSSRSAGSGLNAVISASEKAANEGKKSKSADGLFLISEMGGKKNPTQTGYRICTDRDLRFSAPEREAEPPEE